MLIVFSVQFNYSQTEIIYIDFGSSNSGISESETPWNNVVNNKSGVINNLINSNSENTGIRILVTDDFSGINETGTTNPDVSLGFPSTGTQDSFYGDSSNPTASLELTNLIIGNEYSITFFGSRIGVSDNREASYNVEGITNQSVNLDASNNVLNKTTITFVPRTNGTASINISKGINNNNSSGFFYLGVIKLEYETSRFQSSETALLIDFGANTSLSNFPWNNLSDASTSGSIDNLINVSGQNSGINLNVTDSFNFINEEGSTNVGQSLGFPISAIKDSFFGNTVVFFDKTEPTGAIEFSNFDPNDDLEISLYASRIDYTIEDNKETKYVIEGSTTNIVYLNVANNVNNFVSTKVKPNADGKITITVSPGGNNTNTNGFFYLGAMRIDYDPLPQISLKYPNGGEFWQVGKTPVIKWDSIGLNSDINIEYSINNGGSWNFIDTVSNTVNSFDWIIPNNISDSCLVRLTSGVTTSTSESIFEISNQTESCNIIVLGSSTAEGIGASSLDNSWVNLFKTEVFQKNTSLEVVNLAQGGFSTYNILPTGTPLPFGVLDLIDVNYNITKALSYNPIAIIVNTPSNDTNSGYTLQDQMYNYEILNSVASSVSVPLWIATTQPRNFTDIDKIQLQMEVRDEIIANYGVKAINFWEDIADFNGKILPELNSGDGVHINDSGHLLLYNKVLEAGINNLSCEEDVTLNNISNIKEDITFNIKIYPNPTSEKITLNFETVLSGKVQVMFYNILGKQLLDNSITLDYKKGNNDLPISLNEIIKNTTSQVILALITFQNNEGVFKKTISISIK